MINVVMDEYLLVGFEWIWGGIFQVLPLLAIVLLFDLLLSRRIAARYHRLLWIIVAVRLMIPVSFESRFSMQPLWDSVTTSMGQALLFDQADATEERYNPVEAETGTALAYETFSFQTDEGNRTVRRALLPENPTARQRAAAEAFNSAEAQRAQSDVFVPGFHSASAKSLDPSPTTVDWVAWGIVGTWIVGVCGILGYGFAQSVRFSVALKRSPEVTDQATIDQLLRVCDSAKLGRRPPLKEVDGLSVPAVFGILRPTICLPAGAATKLSEQDLRLVLLHEVSHIKRWDGLVLSVAFFMRALHWFNPLAWLIVSRIRVYMEQAADELTMQHSPQTAAADYGRLLLRYAGDDAATTNPAALGLLLTSCGKALAGRLKMLQVNPQRNSWPARITAALAVVIIGVSGLTDAQQTVATPSDLPALAGFANQSAIPAWGHTTEPASSPPESEVTYDLDQAFEKIRETTPDGDADALLHSLFSRPEGTRFDGRQLIATTTEEQHRQIRGLINALEQSGYWQITYEVRFIEVDLDVVRDLRTKWMTDAGPLSEHARFAKQNQFGRMHFPDNFDHMPGEQLSVEMKESSLTPRPLLSTTVNKSQATRFIQLCQNHTRSNLMMAPKVTLFTGQSACITDETLRPFVTGMRPYDEQPGDGSSTIALASHSDAMQPVIDVLPEGVRILLKGTVTGDERLATRCVLMLSEVSEVELANLPIRTRNDSNEMVTIQVPKATSTSVHAACILERDQCLLIVCPTPFDRRESSQGSSAMCYMISPNWFRPEW